MAEEIERRFLLAQAPNLPLAKKANIVQGYLNLDPARTVRIRVMDDEAYITVKGPKSFGAGKEFEYAIPLEDAREMLAMCGPYRTVEKSRIYLYPSSGETPWEIDIFEGKLGGDDPLVIVEKEFASRDTRVDFPAWLDGSVEITDNHDFSNAALAHADGATIKKLRDRILSGEEAHLVPQHLTEVPPDIKP